MRAIMVSELGPPENMIIEEAPSPTPGEGEVLVKVDAIAVNYPDLLVIEGKYQVIPPLPFVPGKECAGTVAQVGAGVSTLSPGDRVMVQVEFGAYAEEMVAPATNCFPIPDAMSFAEAAAIGVAYQTSHFALIDRAQVQKGETVFVTGATGSVGLAALQLAKAFGCTVIAGVTTMSKADIARENGADAIVDLTVDNLRDSIRDQLRDATGGGGADVIIEIVGGEVFDGSIRALNWRGRLVVVGFTSGTIPTLKANYPLLKNITVTGVNWSDYRDRSPEWVQRVQSEIFDLYVRGDIKVPVQATYPMEQFVDAFDVIRDRQVRGKVVLLTDGVG